MMNVKNKIMLWLIRYAFVLLFTYSMINLFKTDNNWFVIIYAFFAYYLFDGIVYLIKKYISKKRV